MPPFSAKEGQVTRSGAAASSAVHVTSDDVNGIEIVLLRLCFFHVSSVLGSSDVGYFSGNANK